MQFGMLSRVGPGNHVGAHWHNLANTIEMSVCGGNADLQITLTTCLLCYTTVVLKGDMQRFCTTLMKVVSSCLPPPPHHNHFTALFPGPPGWAGARRELLDFMVQGKINRGRHIDHPAGRHSIRTNQCPPPPSPIFFYRPDALRATQPTASKHWTDWRQLAHLD